MRTLGKNKIIQSYRAAWSHDLCPLPESVHKTTMSSSAAAVGPEHGKRVTCVWFSSTTHSYIQDRTMHVPNLGSGATSHQNSIFYMENDTSNGTSEKAVTRCCSKNSIEKQPDAVVCKYLRRHTVCKKVTYCGHSRRLLPVKRPQSKPNVVPGFG